MANKKVYVASTSVLLTPQRQSTNIHLMADTGSTVEVPGSRGGKLKAAPIMVYPTSPEQRAQFQEAADSVGRKLSNFMVYCAEQYIAKLNSSKKTA